MMYTYQHDDTLIYIHIAHTDDGVCDIRVTIDHPDFHDIDSDCEIIGIMECMALMPDDDLAEDIHNQVLLVLPELMDMYYRGDTSWGDTYEVEYTDYYDGIYGVSDPHDYVYF